MSIRPIEWQGAYPRSQDAGKLQEQLQQRGQVGQEIISQQLREEEKAKRKQVNETDETDMARLRDKEKGNEQSRQEQEKGNRKHENHAESQAKHPFKGKFIDFSG